MNQLYVIDDGIVYLNAAAPVDLINWARKMCELQGYELIFVLE